MAARTIGAIDTLLLGPAIHSAAGPRLGDENVHNAITISDFFEDCLGAPLLNTRWSWGAISPSTGHVYLRVWADEFRTVQGRRCVRVMYPSSPSRSPGYSERQRHLRLIRKGAKAFGVIQTAVDPAASPRRIESFDAAELMVGGELSEKPDGFIWLEDAGRCAPPRVRLSEAT